MASLFFFALGSLNIIKEGKKGTDVLGDGDAMLSVCYSDQGGLINAKDIWCRDQTTSHDGHRVRNRRSRCHKFLPSFGRETGNTHHRSPITSHRSGPCVLSGRRVIFLIECNIITKIVHIFFFLYFLFILLFTDVFMMIVVHSGTSSVILFTRSFTKARELRLQNDNMQFHSWASETYN